MKIHRPVGVSVPDATMLDDLARAGVACVEVSLPGPRYLDFSPAAFARRARDAGLAVRSFHLPFYLAPEDGPVDPAALDPAVRRKTAEIHARCLEQAAETGARIAVVHACLEPVEDADRAARLDASRESMAALAARGAELGIVVCVENLPRSCLGNTAAELLSIVAADSRLRVCFDTNHLLLESHAAFLEAAGLLVATLHVSDYDFVNERHWLPGEGKIDWQTLMDGLDAIGYRDAFTYEVSFKGNPKTVLRDRPLSGADFALNAAELEARRALTVHGSGGIPDLPFWP